LMLDSCAIWESGSPAPRGTNKLPAFVVIH
jgi:hypothetical protein